MKNPFKLFDLVYVIIILLMTLISYALVKFKADSQIKTVLLYQDGCILMSQLEEKVFNFDDENCLLKNVKVSEFNSDYYKIITDKQTHFLKKRRCRDSEYAYQKLNMYRS